MRMPHTSTHRGKMVHVVLRDGTHITAKFRERNDRFVFLEGHKIAKADIRAFSPNKGGRP